MDAAIFQTDFKLPGQTGFYRGKVRDVYYLEERRMAAVATDRISAFDVILPRPVPHKGAVLNGIASFFLQKTASIAPNWLVSVPDPNVTVGLLAEPFPVEMVIRGYLVGHAWREYKAGKRSVCGVVLPDGLKENDRLPDGPIITPTTKAAQGHDLDISREEILKKGLVSESHYREMERLTVALFKEGTRHAAKQGLILADTKYEFGMYDGKVILIDEVHTPDSSRYFYAEGFEERQREGHPQRQLSKEFVRQWLISEGFQGQAGVKPPDMDDAFIYSITGRYIELYERILGINFVPDPSEKNPSDRILDNLNTYLQTQPQIK